ARNTKLTVKLIPIILVILVVLAGAVDPTPPKYDTFKRDQRVSYSPDESDIMRIWIVYVAQGDGILIQLPEKFNYDPDPDDSNEEKSERLDVMIDGGSFYSKNDIRMREFLKSIYPQPEITIEHAVITHHDSDHIRGLTRILKEPTIAVQNIYHNGLASYRPKEDILEDIQNSVKAIYDTSSGKIKRVMACLENDKKTIKSSYLINGLDVLRSKFSQEYLHGLYDDLAREIVEKDEPEAVGAFSRVWEGEKFIKETEASVREDLSDIELKLIWPRRDLEAYKDWSHTINGNCLAFRLEYNDFEILFTGDLNKPSQEALIIYLEKNGNEGLLDCDVLKAPHHGSSHSLKDFIVSNGTPPVLAVASMGKRGFNKGWKHPSSDVIEWVGGAHHFYS
ncbi:unnamed protein product, partial [marine sediment metagenome]